MSEEQLQEISMSLMALSLEVVDQIRDTGKQTGLTAKMPSAIIKVEVTPV